MQERDDWEDDDYAEEQDDDEDEYAGKKLGFENQCLFGTSNDKDKWTLCANICFAKLFSDYPKPVPERDYVFVVWRIKEASISKELADQFLNDLLACLPESWINSVTIEEVSKENQKEAKHRYKSGYPWKQMRFDGSVISASELYAMLSLFRLPQENPYVVEELYNIQKTTGFSWDTSFWIACHLSDHSGHLLVTSSDGSLLMKKEVTAASNMIWTYSLKEKCENLKLALVHYLKKAYSVEYRKKNDVGSIFTLAGQVGWCDLRVHNSIFSKVKGLSDTSSYLIDSFKLNVKSRTKKRTRKHATAI